MKMVSLWVADSDYAAAESALDFLVVSEIVVCKTNLCGWGCWVILCLFCCDEQTHSARAHPHVYTSSQAFAVKDSVGHYLDDFVGIAWG